MKYLYYLKRANEIRIKEGWLKLFIICISRLLPRVNIKKVVQFNGVSVLVEQRVYLFTKIKDNPVFEGGVVAAHRKLTRPGDKVVAVGGGIGVTAVIASLLVGKSGSVIVYEGGDKSCENIKHTIRLNNVTNVCRIHHAVVSKGVDVYGGDSSAAKYISPKDLPDCDVLELDCEGAEVDILRNIQINPRVIIVEIHPWLFVEHSKWGIDELELRGYELVYRSGHDGIEINHKDL